MKIPNTISKILENKNVLYVVVFLAVFNLLGYILTGRINSIIIFILVAGAMILFSKNMIIILSVPLLLTSGILVGNKVAENFIGGRIEGMTSKDDATKAPKAATTMAPTNALTKAPSTTKASTKSATTIASLPQGLDLSNDESGDIGAGDGEADVPTENMSLYKKKNNRIDYASTLEDAYGDLSNILGKDGIKNLTSDTQKLMDQQMQLADALKGMAPLIGDAKKMLKGIDISGLTNMAQKFNVPANN